MKQHFYFGVFFAVGQMKLLERLYPARSVSFDLPRKFFLALPDFSTRMIEWDCSHGKRTQKQEQLKHFTINNEYL